VIGALTEPLESWLNSRGFEPFPFQRETWQADADGRSGLLHAPTGMGKTLAVWLGVVDEWLREHDDPSVWNRRRIEDIRAVWLTPLRALATDTTEALRAPIEAMDIPWSVEKRTGDTSSSVKARQAKRLPTALVTTPESLTLLLTRPDARERFASLRCVIVDEWHELLSSKRGVQTELALARLRRWTPGLRTWGLSATLGNIEQARDVLLGSRVTAANAVLIAGRDTKNIVVETLLPDDVERFPWSGHLGLTLIDGVIDALDAAASTLVFTNTRSQAELWFKAIVEARPDWIGDVALHHGSLDADLRARVEDEVRRGRLRAVVCTSSLDLGVDFSPVDQVIQVGSPKGIARLMQRAGRAGHQPGAVSRVLGVPAHAFELIEFAAARDGIERREVEARTPLDKPLDVLVQHLVTVALGGGFSAEQLLEEVRTTYAFRDLTAQEFNWALDFVTRGGNALNAYPQFQRVTLDDETGQYVLTNTQYARLHRMAVGTICADSAMHVRFLNGRSLGTIEETFIARLRPKDRFVFAGHVLELVRLRDMTAQVRRAKTSRGIVPRWGGGRSPLSTLLSTGVRCALAGTLPGAVDSAELAVVEPMLEVQRRVSTIPAADELLIERTITRDGCHHFIFPFEGRLVHEGLGALMAHRLADRTRVTLSITVNDYGIELLSTEAIELDESAWRDLLNADRLADDLLRCLDSDQLARRRFRDIARIAGLIHPGFPGTGKPMRQLQASSELFFDVFRDFDPDNLLLDQARREVLERQLELVRLRTALGRMTSMSMIRTSPERLSPLAFPLFAERLRTQHVTSERWSDRIRTMVVQLERSADSEISDAHSG